MSSSSLLPTVKQRKIRTWKFGDKHLEMAETGALGVFFEGLLLKSMQETPWAGERRENLPQKLWLLYGLMLTPVFLFPLSQGSRVFVAAWGWKTPSHTVQLKTGGKFTAWNRCTSLKQLILCFHPQKIIWCKKTHCQTVCAFLRLLNKQPLLSKSTNPKSSRPTWMVSVLCFTNSAMLRSANATAKLPAIVETTSQAEVTEYVPGRAWMEPSVFRIFSGRTGRMGIEMKNTFRQMTGLSLSCCARGKKRGNFLWHETVCLCVQYGIDAYLVSNWLLLWTRNFWMVKALQ